jgi:hypothetical protein
LYHVRRHDACDGDDENRRRDRLVNAEEAFHHGREKDKHDRNTQQHRFTQPVVERASAVRLPAIRDASTRNARTVGI